MTMRDPHEPMNPWPQPFPIATFTARATLTVPCAECKRLITAGQIVHHLSSGEYVHAADCS